MFSLLTGRTGFWPLNERHGMANIIPGAAIQTAVALNTATAVGPNGYIKGATRIEETNSTIFITPATLNAFTMFMKFKLRDPRMHGFLGKLNYIIGLFDNSGNAGFAIYIKYAMAGSDTMELSTTGITGKITGIRVWTWYRLVVIFSETHTRIWLNDQKYTFENDVHIDVLDHSKLYIGKSELFILF